jgi:hypothetical protein
MSEAGISEKVLQRHVRTVINCIPAFMDIVRDPESDFCLQFEGHLREIRRRLPEQDFARKLQEN